VRSARYRLADLGYAIGRAPVAAAERIKDLWLGLSIFTRRRLAVGLAAVVAIAVILVAAVPALPCQAPGGDACPPADDAIDLVPDDALAYLHVNADPATEQFTQATRIATQAPTISKQGIDQLLAQLPGPNGSQVDFARDLEPWFGGEAALAIVPAGAGAAQEVQLLEVSDEQGARKFADSIGAGKPQSTAYRGVQISVDRRGLATALVGSFLAIGRESGVRDMIDAQSGAKGTGSLAGDPDATAALDALPATRLADAYLSEDGIARLVANPRAPLATLASVINPGASRGVAAALVASPDGIDVDVRSELDPERAKAHPGFFSAFSSFTPTLAAVLPAGSLGYLGFGDPGSTLKSLLEQASVEEPGLAAAVGSLTKRVKQLGNVDLEKDLLPSLGDEAAFALQPTPSAGALGAGNGGKHRGGKGSDSPAPPGTPPAPEGALSNSQTPFLEFIGAGIDAGAAGKALASLQEPIAKALNASSDGQAPAFSEHKVGDATAQSLQLSPTVDLTYAISGSNLVIATNPAGVEQVATGDGGLDGAPLFDQATSGFPGTPSVLGYLDLGRLISLGEEAGLSQDPAYATFAPEIRTLRALGLAVQSSPDELSTDLRLVVAQGSGTADAETAAPTD
jgi:hypothetical protein